MAQKRRVQTRRIVRLYKEGHSTTEVGRLVGLAQTTVWRRLMLAGIKRRPRGGINARRGIFDRKRKSVTRLVWVTVPRKKIQNFKIFKAA